MATDELTIRSELEGFIQASGADVGTQMKQVRSLMDLYFMHGQWACTNDLPEKAIRSFKACLKIVPNAPIVHCALGRIHLTRGELVKAERHAPRAFELQPNDLKNILTSRLIIAKLGRDPLAEDRLALSIRSRITAAAQSYGLATPAWPWGPKVETGVWCAEPLRKVAAEFRKHRFTVLRGVMPAGWVELLRAE